MSLPTFSRKAGPWGRRPLLRTCCPSGSPCQGAGGRLSQAQESQPGLASRFFVGPWSTVRSHKGQQTEGRLQTVGPPRVPLPPGLQQSSAPGTSSWGHSGPQAGVCPVQPKKAQWLSTLEQNPGQARSRSTLCDPYDPLQATSSLVPPAGLIGPNSPSVPKGRSSAPHISCQLPCPIHTVRRPGPETSAGPGGTLSCWEQGPVGSTGVITPNKPAQDTHLASTERGAAALCPAHAEGITCFLLSSAAQDTLLKALAPQQAACLL